MACAYCYYGTRGGRSADFETLKAAVDLSVSRGGGTGICFFGGEPLLEQPLIERLLDYTDGVRKSTGQSFSYKMTTNGTLLTEAFLQTARRFHMLVALSHDGLMTAGGRRYTDGCRVTGEQLRLLLDYQPYAIVMTVVTPQSAPQFADSVDYLFRQGFRHFITSPAYGTGIAWDEDALRVLEEQYKKLAQLYIKWTKAGEKFYFAAFESKIASHTQGAAYRRAACQLGRDQLSIAPDGKIYPCTQFVGDDAYCIGDVFTGIDETARARVAAIACGSSVCRGCALEFRCVHTCACANKLGSGQPDQVSPMQCAHEKMLIRTADNMAATLYRKKFRRFMQKHYDPNNAVISLLEDQLRARGRR
jgi:uncharacterized protein